MFVWYGALQRQHIMYMHHIQKLFLMNGTAHSQARTHTHGKETDTHIRTLDETRCKADENQSQAKAKAKTRHKQNEQMAKKKLCTQ